MRLIDADALIEKLGRDADYYFPWVLEEIIDSPTVEVVRCAECKHDDYCCRDVGKGKYRLPRDFCSYGERKENT